MSEYDSILKENKKKVVVIQEEPKKFPKFWVSFLLIIIVLVVSYVIYFNKVLSTSSIVINDFFSVLNKYSSLIKVIPIDEFREGKNLVGVIQYGQDKYDFNIVKNSNNLGFNISSNDKYINYYLLDSEAYVKVPSISEYVSLDYTFSINTLLNLKQSLDSISAKKNVKNVYLDGKKPIVEVNLSLNQDEVNEIFGLNLKDEYDIIVTLKNSAIMNNIEEIKIVINNKTKKDRRVVTINDNVITYTVGSDVYKMVLQVNGNNFMFKVSKNDVLYSVLSGIDNGDNYQYTYQIIDMVYNINVLATKSVDGYLYEIKSKKENVEELININLKVEDNYLIESYIVNFIESSNQLIANNYNNDINYFKDKFLKFVE